MASIEPLNSASGIPYYELPGPGSTLVFLHANGYPPLSYQPLLEKLAQTHRVIGMCQRPLWPGADPTAIQNWEPLAADLVRFCCELSPAPSLGVGHSVGGNVLLRAALLHPDFFQAIVLIDPVFFPRCMTLLWSAIFRLGLGYRLHPLVRGAVRRRRVFTSKALMFERYRRAPVFSKIEDEGLQFYINAMAKPRPDGSVELAYPPEWEARIYLTSVLKDLPLWSLLHTLKPPVLIVRGEHTDTFWHETARRFLRKLPDAQVVTIPDATHLLPLEKPQAVFSTINKFLSSLEL